MAAPYRACIRSRSCQIASVHRLRRPFHYWPAPPRLLHGHTLRQVSGLIDITAAQQGDMVSKQLKRYRRKNRIHQRICIGNIDRVIGLLGDFVISLCCYSNDDPVPYFDFFDVTHRLSINSVLRRKYNHGHFGIDQSDRPMLHFACWIAFCMDVGDLFELQRAFHCNWVMNAAAKVEEIPIAPEALRESSNALALVEYLVDLIRNIPELPNMPFDLMLRLGT